MSAAKIKSKPTSSQNTPSSANANTKADITLSMLSPVKVDKSNASSAALEKQYKCPKYFDFEYEFLIIQPREAYFIICSLQDGQESDTQSMLYDKVLLTKKDNQTDQDIHALKLIFSRVLVDAARFGVSLGFRPFQMGVWITLNIQFYKMFDISNGANYQTTFQDLYCELVTKKDYYSPQETVFNETECKEIIEYMGMVIGLHFNLFKFVLMNSQHIIINKKKKRLELLDVPFPPLSSAINVLDWPDYVKKNAENAEKKLKELADQEIVRKQREVDEFERKEAEKITIAIKARLVEAEKNLISPLPPYPIPPPSIPTLEKIFRKQVIEAIPATEPLLRAPPKSAAALAPPKEQEKERKGGKTQPPVAAIPLGTENQSSSIKGPHKPLVPPPDLHTSLPLVRKKLGTAAPVEVDIKPEIVEQSKVMIEYVDIALDQPLSRPEAASIVVASVISAVEQYKKWVVGLVEWEEQQWATRSLAVQKLRQERDADHNQNVKIIEEKKLRGKIAAANAVANKSKPAKK